MVAASVIPGIEIWGAAVPGGHESYHPSEFQVPFTAQGYSNSGQAIQVGHGIASFFRAEVEVSLDP